MGILDSRLQESLRSAAMRIFRSHSLPRWMVFMFDGTLVFFSFLIAYLLRFNFVPRGIDFSIAISQGLLVMVIYCGYELVFKSYAGLIRHTTIRDIFKIILTTTSTLLTLLLLEMLELRAGWNEVIHVPLSVIVIHYVSLNALLFFSRILVKMLYELVLVKPTAKKNVIIFGAGSMGVIVKRVIQSDTASSFHIVALLDNNRKLQSKNIDGIPVFSPKRLTLSFLEKHRVRTMIFAIRDIPGNEKAEIFRFAVDLGLEVLEVPAVDYWLNGRFQLSQLQRIKLQDLLSRDPIQLNMKRIGDGIRDRVVMVTGAAGSIGSEIVRQLTRFQVSKLVLVDNAETPMFNLENELQEHYGFAPVRTILADVTDKVKMDRIFRECNPEIIFHTAAYKHVPLMEENPHEAIRVNVGGTMLLTRLAMKYGVGKFVMVSTDKAVNPTNVMGASKRLCELIVHVESLACEGNTQFVITRFGNVLGSNGSVIPIFRRQIEEGGPVTVTHPGITRYFMTIPEASQLVLEAGFMGKGGEIYVFDMGEPVKIADLARQMIRLSGLVPDKDILIEYTGLRPGEKLYEELLANRERTLPTYNPKVRIAELSQLDPDKVLSDIIDLLVSYERLSEIELVQKIRTIVPEYVSSNLKYADPGPDRESVQTGHYSD